MSALDLSSTKLGLRSTRGLVIRAGWALSEGKIDSRRVFGKKDLMAVHLPRSVGSNVWSLFCFVGIN